MTVVFLHPDLGLGGAERLVVDAASHLVANGHRVVVLTAHHDRARAFPATVDGSLDVRVRGGALPAQVLGHLRAPCAIVRMAWLALGLRGLRPQPDVVVCDLVAHAIPLARLAGRAPVVLYCHHPDRFLAPAGRGLYRWYRAPIDRLEAFGTACAARVLVNSRYTAARVREAFPTLATEPDVIHPGVDLVPCADLASDATGPATILAMERAPAGTVYNVGGGVEVSILQAIDTLGDIAGRQLELTRRPRVEGDVARTSADTSRLALLAAARCVVHTPADEHFGYVPVEAMAAGRPVVAARSGGPAETVVDGETGFLCTPTPEAFGEALARLVTDPGCAARLGRAGRRRAAEQFSRAAFGARFAAVLAGVTTPSS